MKKIPPSILQRIYKGRSGGIFVSVIAADARVQQLSSRYA